MFSTYGEVASGLKECLSNMGPWYEFSNALSWGCLKLSSQEHVRDFSTKAQAVRAALCACTGQHRAPRQPTTVPHRRSLGDLTLGIRHVGLLHDREDVADQLPGRQLTRETAGPMFEYLRREITIARAAYSIAEGSHSDIAKAAQLPEESVVHVCDQTAKFQPAFFIAKDGDARLVRVVVRGTSDMHDVLTDMAGKWVPLQDGFAHEGMLQAAEWLLEATVPVLEGLQRDDIAGCAAPAPTMPTAQLRPCRARRQQTRHS
jgi:hypothetical protein